jgi:hypothetical protein
MAGALQAAQEVEPPGTVLFGYAQSRQCEVIELPSCVGLQMAYETTISYCPNPNETNNGNHWLRESFERRPKR